MADYTASLATPVSTLRTTLGRERLVLVVVAVMLGNLLSSLQQTIIATGMPRIIADLNGMQHYAWVFTAYMLASTVTIPIWGKLSDLYGRRLFYLSGIVLFLTGSALSGMAQTYPQLIVFRSIQGIGSGGMMPIVQAIIGDVFTPAERGRWQGIMTAMFGLAAIAGPTVGGWMTDNLGWRWLFYFNMPIGLLTIAMAAWALPAANNRVVRHRIDWRGVFLLLLGTTPMLLAFSWAGGDYAWTSWPVMGLLVFAALMLTTFFWGEGSAAEPIIAPSLFRSSIFAVSAAVSFLINGAMYGAIMYIPLFVQGVTGGSATGSGAVLMPLLLAFTVASIVGGQLLSITGRYKLIALSGLAVSVAGIFLLSTMDSQTPNGQVVVNMIVAGIGIGAMSSLFTIVVQNAFPFSQMGAVTSSLQFFRSIGGTVCVAVLGSFMASKYQSQFSATLPDQLRSALPADRLAALQNPQVLVSPQALAQLQQSFAAQGEQGQAIFQQLIATMHQALTVSLQNVFLLGAVGMALAFLITLFLREIPLRASFHQLSEAETKEKQLG